MANMTKMARGWVAFLLLAVPGLALAGAGVSACNTETIITPEPLPVPEQLFTEVYHSLTDTYENAGVFQVYKVWATNAAGDLLPVWSLGVPVPAQRRSWDGVKAYYR